LNGILPAREGGHGETMLKMLKKTIVSALGLALGCAGVVSAQTPPPTLQPGNTVLVAQYECSPADLGKVDQIMKDTTAPVLNRMLSEGKLIAWGTLGAYVGGPANRTIYVWAKDPVALLQARAVYLPEIMAKPGWAELSRLCPKQQVTLNNLIHTPASTR
jgi:hypothetical protein